MTQRVTVVLIAAMFASVVGCGDPGPLGDTRWVLESLNGHPAVEGIHPTLRVNGKSYGGQDGCNAFSGRSWNGGPIATAEGTFSAPPSMGTLRGCDSAEVADQSDAYMEALMEGEKFVVEDDRLEIMDGSGEIRLVYYRQRPLSGQTAKLAETKWRLLDEEADGDRATTLAFLNDRIVAIGTACWGYVAEYTVSGSSIRFPGMSLIGANRACPDELREMEKRHVNDLFWAGDFAVDDGAGGSILRIRTRRHRTLVYEPLPPAVDGILHREGSLTAFVEPRKMSSYTRYSYTTDVLDGTELTISFGENDVSGSAGCNSYSAPLRSAGSTIEVGKVTAAQVECKGPEGVMEQERRFLGILTDVNQFNIYGDRLAMLTGGDEVLLFDAR